MYQAFDVADIPRWHELNGAAQLRLIAGSLHGHTGPVRSFGNPWLLHLTLAAGAVIDVPLAGVEQAAAYLISGSGRFADAQTLSQSGQLVRFEGAGQVKIQAGANGIDLLLLGGDPLDAPIVRYGPFVMNTQSQLQQAVQAFQRGLMGRIEH